MTDKELKTLKINLIGGMNDYIMNSGKVKPKIKERWVENVLLNEPYSEELIEDIAEKWFEDVSCYFSSLINIEN